MESQSCSVQLGLTATKTIFQWETQIRSSPPKNHVPLITSTQLKANLNVYPVQQASHARDKRLWNPTLVLKALTVRFSIHYLP